MKRLVKSTKRIIKAIIFYIPPLRRLYQRWYWLVRKPNLLQKRKTNLRFDVHLAEHCNLKCIGCEHFSSLAKEEYLNIDSFKKDCVRLSELTNNNIEEIFLLGGEPLLNKEIIDYFPIIRENFPYCKVKIVTNGLLLTKKDSSFWINCNKYDIEINISVYPVKLDFNKINELAKQYNVLVTYCNIDLLEWVRRPIDISGKQNIKKIIKRCYQLNQCIQLVDGKLFTCARIAYIKHFNNYFGQNLIVTDKDYIDIYKAKNLDEILDFLCKPVPFCRYCNLKITNLNMSWSASKYKITEWVNP